MDTILVTARCAHPPVLASSSSPLSSYLTGPTPLPSHSNYWHNMVRNMAAASHMLFFLNNKTQQLQFTSNNKIDKASRRNHGYRMLKPHPIPETCFGHTILKCHRQDFQRILIIVSSKTPPPPPPPNVRLLAYTW